MSETQPLVEALAARVEEYIFPDRAAAAAVALRENLRKGVYADLGGEALCERLNADLLTACNDKHLRLIWHETALEPPSEDGEAQVVTQLREIFRLEGQGVRRVERLNGNVGLIELTIIPSAAESGAAVGAAMTLVAGTDALILDLRGTRGGAPDGVAFWCSFFFPDGETHLCDVVQGATGPTRQFWTTGYVPGPRYLDRPVFVLTSGDTFSGGEELAYDLQALERATVIGEPTGGGAHPVELLQLTPHVELRMPVARSVNPVTGGNWEGTGVQPDVWVSSEDALDAGHRAAMARATADA